MTVTDAQIGERVHELMWRQRLSQTALASKLGLTQGTVSRKLRGSTAWFATELITVADVLGTDVGELCAIRDSNPEPAGLELAPSARSVLWLSDRRAGGRLESVAA